MCHDQFEAVLDTNFPIAFFVILYTWLVFMFIYRKYKSLVVDLIDSTDLTCTELLLMELMNRTLCSEKINLILCVLLNTHHVDKNFRQKLH
jgi:hypothetical protein